MNRPALFFDRDNTLIANDGYLRDPAGVRLIAGAADAIARGRAMGYLIVTVSNQSGVARGLCTEADVNTVNARMDQMLRAENTAAIIDRHEYCPDHPEAPLAAYRRDSDRRKPGAGMIHSAAGALGIDLTRSWLIGDAPRDIEAGRRAGLRTILFHDPALPPSPAASEAPAAEPERTVHSLREAIDYIEASTVKSPPPALDGQPAPAAAAPTPAAPPPAQPPSPESTPGLRTLEQTAHLILQELRRRSAPSSDFSVSRLMAGITQVLAIATLFFAYLNRGNATLLQNILLLALVLESLTIALLLMGRAR